MRTVFCLALLITVGCARGGPGLTGEIKAGGSSTVYPLTAAVTEEFVKKHPGVKISVGVSGTGGGFEQFCRSASDIQNASRPINDREQTACEGAGVSFIEIPVAYDALTIIVHPTNDWASSMTLAELKKLWEPRADAMVVRWSDVRPEWPAERIRLFGPGTASGTFDYFTETVTGGIGASRKDYTASEDDAVIVKGVAGDRYALGYVGYGHFENNRASLKAVPIAGQNAERLGAVLPSPDNVQRGAYRPLSRSLFIYVNAKSIDRPEVSEFVNFYLKQDEAIVREVGGIPMSHLAYQLVRQRVAKKTPGTLFADGRGNESLELLLTQAQK